MTSNELPFGPDDLDRLFRPVFGQPVRGVALAVSGGSDSTGLMVLSAEWLAQTGGDASAIFVLTVDHGLRPQSASEARWVEAAALRLGFRHAVLPWLGAKPKTGLQAAARAARYALLADFMRAAGLGILLTAHTADDQAETLLMRLARGSGVDGLAAMAPWTALVAPTSPPERAILLARPLLTVSKARLKAALVARGMSWLEDESNAAPVFERSRLRAAQDTLLRLGLTQDSLGLSAQRLQWARAALDWAVAQFCRQEACYRVDPAGLIRIDAAAWAALPSELKVRVLLKGITAAGGEGRPLARAKLEALCQSLDAALASPRGTGRWTLARTAVRAARGKIVLEREPGRRPWPELSLAPGTRALWDGRFWVAAGPKLGFPVAVRALGASGLQSLRGEVTLPEGVPAGTLRALPGFYRGSVLFAVPSLAFPAAAAADPAGAAVSAIFAPLAQPETSDSANGAAMTRGPR
jgi:tRNA(Ile)-lysidine synthase